jgi:hypothetical protein
MKWMSVIFMFPQTTAIFREVLMFRLRDRKSRCIVTASFQGIMVLGSFGVLQVKLAFLIEHCHCLQGH